MGDLINLNRNAAISDNIPGVHGKIFVAKIDKFLAISGFVNPIVDPEDKVTITGDHTFDVADGFLTLELDHKTNMFEGEKAGDWGSNNKKFTIKGNFHGVGKLAAAAELELNNADVMLLVTKHDPFNATPPVLQFGLENLPARCVDAKWTSGTADSGSAGIEFTFEVFQPSLAYYEGTITMQP